MSTHQRTWAEVGMRDAVKVELYDQFNQGGSAYLGSSDIEVGFASASKRTDVPYDQDDLAKAVIYVSPDSSQKSSEVLTQSELPKSIVCSRSKDPHGS